MKKIIGIYHRDSETIRGLCRVDFIGRKVGKIDQTSEGYLTGQVPIAKIGIMNYFLEDGLMRRELVNENTLFNSDSMSTLHMKPVTDTHPPERLLNSKTVKRRKVGYTGETVKKDGDFLTTSVVITDDDAIQNINNGRQELSPGYHCDLLMEPGTFQGLPYDGIQVNRRYNHVAVCDRARGGSDLKLHLDNIEHFDGFEVNEDALGEGRGVGGKRQGIGGATTCKCPSCGYMESHNRNTPCAEKSCPKCGTKMVGINTDTANLLDSDFCFISGTGEDKIRKFPANDAAHIRDCIIHLDQSNLNINQKALVLTNLKERAKNFNIEVNLDSINIVDEYNFNQRELTLLNKRKEHNMPQLRIDNIDYEAAQEVINFTGKQTARADTAEEKMKGLQIKLDTAEGERDGLKTKVDELEKIDHTAAIQEGIQIRQGVLDAADIVLDDEKKKDLDKMKVDEIKAAVITAKSPDVNLDGKSVEYINARFDAIIEGLNFDTDAAGKQRSKATHRHDSSLDPVEKARTDSEERMQNDYKTLGGRIKE